MPGEWPRGWGGQPALPARVPDSSEGSHKLHPTLPWLLAPSPVPPGSQELVSTSKGVRCHSPWWGHHCLPVPPAWCSVEVQGHLCPEGGLKNRPHPWLWPRCGRVAVIAVWVAPFSSPWPPGPPERVFSFLSLGPSRLRWRRVVRGKLGAPASCVPFSQTPQLSPRGALMRGSEGCGRGGKRCTRLS